VTSISNNENIVLGVMSGTSLDGLDLALCSFRRSQDKWNWKLLESKTISYSTDLRNKLENAPVLSGQGIVELDNEFGYFIGMQSKAFIDETGLQVNLISSHGHTIYHQPEKRLTFQAGSGACIAALTGITTVTDFRRTDIALGGQGAPLVPVGDEFLFSEYDYCLNLGGFANISFRYANHRIAFDICPVNIVLNLLARRTGHLYDKNGITGSSGNINTEILTRLDHLDFYKVKPPKSLGREWLEREFIPVMDEKDLTTTDKLRTVYEHIAKQIALVPDQNETVLITGGGAHNQFLMDLIKRYCKAECILPEDKTIDFKEAIIFAFLGLLCIRKEINCLASVTGASRDSCCGVISSGTDHN
jgi:anhydro-N-acetylmuramic acid kinase